MKYPAIACFVALSGALASPALAADLPGRSTPPSAPVMAAPAPLWTGFYLGIFGGYGWTDSDLNAAALRQNNVNALTPSGFAPKGGMIGATVGYNWQIGQIVLGVEGDYAWTRLKSSTPLIINYSNALGNIPAFGSADLTYIATARGRIGYAFDRVLVYVTGGYAMGRASGRLGANFFGAQLSFGDSKTHGGWAIGGGGEVLLTRNLTAKVEVLHVDLADKKYNIGGGNVPVGIGLGVTSVRAGLNYKF